jgi:hypothetical protein
MREQREQDQVGIVTVDAMRRVPIVVFSSLLLSDEFYNLVLAFPGDRGI